MKPLTFWLFYIAILIIAGAAMSWARTDPPFGPGLVVGLCIAAACILGGVFRHGD